MNMNIVSGRFHGSKKTYRSKNGAYYFKFEFVDRGPHIDVFCRSHPSFNGKNSDPERTHLYRSGRLCFIKGNEPRNQKRAEELASQWAEYFLEYRRTGKTQS